MTTISVQDEKIDPSFWWSRLSIALSCLGSFGLSSPFVLFGQGDALKIDGLYFWGMGLLFLLSAVVFKVGRASSARFQIAFVCASIVLATVDYLWFSLLGTAVVLFLSAWLIAVRLMKKDTGMGPLEKRRAARFSFFCAVVLIALASIEPMCNDCRGFVSSRTADHPVYYFFHPAEARAVLKSEGLDQSPYNEREAAVQGGDAE